MLKQPRNTAAGADEQAVVCTAALKALTRLLQTPAPRPMGDTASGAAAPPAAAALLGRGGRLLSREEIQELQDAVRGMVSELHSRRGMLSFPLLSVALTSLEVLLPAFGGSWRAAGVRPDDAAGRLLELVAELPRAAADADKVQLVPLPALRDAFRAGLRLTQMTQPLLQQQASYAAPGRPGPATQQVVGQEVRAYLRRAVFATASGSGDAGGQAEAAAAVDAAAAAARLQGADLAAMAAAAELAVMWDMEVAPAVMQLHVRHVDRLLAAAAAGPAYELTGSADHQPLARVGTSSGDDEGPSTSYRTAGRGHGRATREALGGARSRGRGGAPPRGRRGAAAGGGAPANAYTDESQQLPDGLVIAGQLDVTSLAQLLVAWASVPAGRHAPSAEWLDRAAALALRTQDPATMAKKAQLLRKLRRLRGERQQVAEQLRQLHAPTAPVAAAATERKQRDGWDGRTAEVRGPDQGAALSGAGGTQPGKQRDSSTGAARAAGRGAGRGGGRVGGGRGRDVAPASAARALPPGREAGGPGAQQLQPAGSDGSDRLKAMLKEIGREIEALQQELAALGPMAVAPAAAGGAADEAAPTQTTPLWKRRQQQHVAPPEVSAVASTPATPAKHAHSDQQRPQQLPQQQQQQQPQQHKSHHDQGSPAGGIAQLGYALEPAALTALLWAIGGCLGDTVRPETRALTRAVAVGRVADFTSPQQLIAVLYALSHTKSVPSREEVGEFTKRLRPHLESLPPADAVRLLQALEALGYNPPARPWQRQPHPHPQSPGLDASSGSSELAWAPSGAEVVGRLMVMVDGLLGAQLGGSSIASSAGLEPGARGLAAAPSGLILQLLRSCAAWSVPFPEEFMGALESVVEQRVLRSLPPDQIQMLSARAMANATLTNRGGSRAGPTAALQAAPSVADANADAMRLGLLEGVILPLAATRQGFANGDMFYLALRDWSEVESWKGLTVEKATSLLNAFAYSKSWALVPQLRKAVEGLMERALRLPMSTPREGAKLLLAVGRALRVMGDKMQCAPAEPIANKVAPSVAPLLLPAVEQILRLQPNASDAAAVIKGLFVEARWRVPVSSANATGCTDGEADALAASEQATRCLLAELTAAAERGIAGTRVLSFAWLLEGSAALQYRPSHDTMAQLYGAAAERLAERPSKAEEVVELLNSVTGLDGVLPSDAGSVPAPLGATGVGGRRASAADESKARGRLLQQLAMAALREPALPVLASKPEDMVSAVRQMTALGLRPPAQWLPSCTTVVQAVLPELSPSGLAYAAEGLALLGAAPPSAFLDILLTCADKHGADRFDPQALGLLLGGAHALRQNALAAQAAAERRLSGIDGDEDGGEAADGGGEAWTLRQAAAGVPVVAPLSKAAQEAWGRAHAAFVSEARKSNPMPRYSRAQQLLVVSAAVSFELSRPPLSQQAPAAAGGGGKSPGQAGAKAAGRTTVDFRARLESDWLAETCASLLASRKAMGATATGAGGAGNAALLPTPAMLENLLRLASRVLGDRTDGTIARLARATNVPGSESVGAANLPFAAVGSSAAAAAAGRTDAAPAADEQALAQESARSSVVEFVRLSIQDLSSVTGERRTADFPAWISLLRSALQAGTRLSPSELSVFAAALLNFAARRTRRALTAKGASGPSASTPERVVAPSEIAVPGETRARTPLQLSPEGGELMSAVWRDVEEGLEGVLLPVLPWVPPDETLKTLRLGLLEQPPAVLTAASLRQLALLCTYTTQAAQQLAAEAVGAKRTAWWSNVRAELLRRAQEEEVEKAWPRKLPVPPRAAESSGSSTTASILAPAPQVERAVLDGRVEDHSDISDRVGKEAALQTAGDLAAVCYGLLMHGGSSGGREGRDSSNSVSVSSSLPDQLAKWMRLLLLHLARCQSAAATETLFGTSCRSERQVGLRALQLLWVARAVGHLPFVPDSVWCTAFGAFDPETTAVPALQLRQVVQLVVLRAEAVRAYSSSPQQQPPPSAESWFMEVWLGRLATACRRTLLAKRPSRGGTKLDADGITPGVAALAVAYCLPPAERPPAYAVVLATAALPALGAAAGPGGAAAASVDQALSLADVWAFMQRVESWPVAAASAGAGSNAAGGDGDGTARWTGLPAEAVAAICQRLKAASTLGPGADGLVPALEAAKFAVTLLNVAAVDGSPAALEAALPLLQALVPDAEPVVWALAAHERLGRAVMASALQAGLNAVTNTEPPLGADGALTSASEVAAVMVGSVAVLLQLQEQRLQVAAQLASKNGTAVATVAPLPLDVRGLPPDQLAALASAVIRVCCPAISVGVPDGTPPVISRAAAAVLLQLLSTPGVVERLPVTRLEAALTRILPGQTGVGPTLPMTEAVAQAISAKLQVGGTAGFARTPVGLALQLHRCGSSGVLLQRALLADRKWAGREVELLQALALAEPREPLALSLRNYDPENLAAEASSLHPERGEGPFSCLALDLSQSLRRSSRVQGMRLAAAAAGLRALAAVLPRLGGTAGAYYLYGALAAAPLHVLEDPARAVREIHADPAAAWRLLEALLALAGRQLNARAFAIVARKLHLQRLGNLSAPEHPLDAARDEQRFAVQQDEFNVLLGFVSGLGPYLTSAADSRVLLAATQPALDRHQQRLHQLLTEPSATTTSGTRTGSNQDAAPTSAAAGAFWWPPDSAQSLPEALLKSSGLRLPEGDPDLLSARQLGLLYGAVAVRGSGAMEGVPYDAVAAEAKELHLAYVTSLNLLDGRTDLPPHQHLDAMLAALEPAVFVNPQGMVLPASRRVDSGSSTARTADGAPAEPATGPDLAAPDAGAPPEAQAAQGGQAGALEADGNIGDFYSTFLPLERFLAPVLARCAAAGAAEQPYPEGVELWDDVNALYGLAELSEEAMLAGLYGQVPYPEAQQRPGEEEAEVSAASHASSDQNPAFAKAEAAPAPAPNGGVGAASTGAERVAAELAGPAVAVAQPAQTPATGRGAWADKPRPAARPAHEDWVQQYVPVVVLPTHLRPPPGRRHGQPGGDAAADAAREAYVRSVAPSLALLRRLLGLAIVSERRQHVLAALEAYPGFEGFGEGRWARLLEFVVALDKAQERAGAEEEEEEDAARGTEAVPASAVSQEALVMPQAGGGRAGAAGSWGGVLQRMASDLVTSVASGVLADDALGAAARAKTGPLLQDMYMEVEGVAAAATDAQRQAAVSQIQGLEALAPLTVSPDRAGERLSVASDATVATGAAEAGDAAAAQPQQPADAAAASSSTAPAQVNPFEVTADFKRRLEALGYQVPERGSAGSGGAGGAAGSRRRLQGQQLQQRSAAQEAEEVGKAVLDAAVWVGGALGSYLGSAAQSVVQRAVSRLSPGGEGRSPDSGNSNGSQVDSGGSLVDLEQGLGKKEQEAEAQTSAPGLAADAGVGSTVQDAANEGVRRDGEDEDSLSGRRLRRREAGPNRPQGRGFGKSKN
ncbi:hypothetical protein HYH02_013032 [Chlamydomonas schloesseri]|uniref:Uncharacterized protein n=1 Tax=Chlamydomonas schloesseri TaxID=2026947 RepID=A0A835VWV6_9CHLO|nr:hypothetical protein HYH02_013032 [Chlamydomonas schloesseri]|eukprot:KAG2432312.1 hypothetical protein HYH02_013032 [Chlamydomonas schloesseri]